MPHHSLSPLRLKARTRQHLRTFAAVEKLETVRSVFSAIRNQPKLGLMLVQEVVEVRVKEDQFSGGFQAYKKTQDRLGETPDFSGDLLKSKILDKTQCAS